MKRVLLTGAAGFVGAAVLHALSKKGRDIAVLLRATSDTRRISHLMNEITVIRGDLSNLGDIHDQIAAFKPEGVVHLAWEGVKGAERNSQAQLSNVVTSIALYRLTESLGCSRFVGIGSQAEYGPQTGRIDESAVPRPTTIYGAAKLATSVLLERAAATSGRSFAWLRLFSSYGPGDDPSWLIPYVIGRLLARKKPSLSAAEQVWDYIHIEDVAGAIIAALDSEACGVFNLGSGQAQPLREIVTIIRDLIDPSLELGFGEVPYRSDQVMHLEADISALENATGWSPSVSLRDGLRGVIEEHRRQAMFPG